MFPLLQFQPEDRPEAKPGQSDLRWVYEQRGQFPTSGPLRIDPEMATQPWVSARDGFRARLFEARLATFQPGAGYVLQLAALGYRLVSAIAALRNGGPYAFAAPVRNLAVLS